MFHFSKDYCPGVSARYKICREISVSFISLKKAVFHTSFIAFTLRKTFPYSELFWSVFSRIRTEQERHGVSLRIQSECDKMRTRITPNTGTFHAVLSLLDKTQYFDGNIVSDSENAFSITEYLTQILVG